MNRFVALILGLGLVLVAGGPFSPAWAQAADPPYEPQMQRLSEILGALHYLRPLCGADEKQTWRAQMEALLAAEEPTGRRRERLIDRFNIGYSGFAAIYRTCTPAAAVLAEKYQKEGAQIARDITTRYGR